MVYDLCVAWVAERPQQLAMLYQTELLSLMLARASKIALRCFRKDRLNEPGGALSCLLLFLSILLIHVPENVGRFTVDS